MQVEPEVALCLRRHVTDTECTPHPDQRHAACGFKDHVFTLKKIVDMKSVQVFSNALVQYGFASSGIREIARNLSTPPPMP
jgi:hypothetical protein